MYGSTVLRIIELLGIGNKIVYPVGIFFIAGLSFIFSFLAISTNNRIICLSVGFIVLLSPPIELLLQRGNLDAFIFILVFFSSILILRNKFFLSLLLSVCSLIKFYTFPLLVYLSILYTLKRRKKFISQIYLFVIFLVCIIDIRNVSYFPSDAQNFFGSPIFGEYLSFLAYGPGSHGNLFISQALGLLFYLLTCKAFAKISRIIKIYPVIYDSKSNNKPLVLFSINFLIFISCYFAGLNIDYRLVFIAAATLSFLNIEAEQDFWPSICLTLAILIILYTSYNTYILQPIGDFFILFTISYFTVFFIKERIRIFNSIFSIK